MTIDNFNISNHSTSNNLRFTTFHYQDTHKFRYIYKKLLKEKTKFAELKGAGLLKCR